jgi:carboxyl-terminal processing protease
MTRRWRSVVVALLAGFFAVFLTGTMVTRNLALDTTYTNLRLFNEVLSLIQKSYVDEVDSPELMKGAYEGMLSGLDPFSEYFTAEEYAAAQASARKPARKEAADVGLRLARKEGSVLVVAVKPGSDAESRGITPGDHVRRLGDASAREMHLFEIEERLAGAPGSTLTVQVARREEPRKIEADLQRKATPMPQPAMEVRDAAAGTAVLRIPHFQSGATQQVAGLLERAQKQKVRRLLIDLRGNAWGTMEEAARCAGLFTGDVVAARLKGKQEVLQEIKPGRGRGAYTGDVAVLMNASTAEAAEMFAAALHDTRSAKLMGDATFGVGATQEFIALNNGGWLKLSTAKYVSPAGTAWHGSGLKPDTPLPVTQESLTPAQRLEKQLDLAMEHLRDDPGPAADARDGRPEDPGAL